MIYGWPFKQLVHMGTMKHCFHYLIRLEILLEIIIFFFIVMGDLNKGGGSRYWDGGKTIRWFGGTGVSKPSGIQGQSLVRELGDKVSQKVKNFKSSYKFYAILVVFHTFSPT